MTDIQELTYEDILQSTDPAWETMCELGRSLVQSTDGKQWELGDLALEVDKEYGKNRIGEWAKAIGSPVSTVKQYRRMSGYYEKDIRVSFPNLTRAHFLKAICGNDLETSLSLLNDAANGDWTSERVQVERKLLLGRPALPKKLMDYEGEITDIDVERGSIVIALAPGANMLNLIDLQDRLLRFKVYEVAA